MNRGEIWQVRLPLPPGGAGHEQAGARPALVVQANADEQNNPMRVVVPLTSKLAALRFPYTVRVEPSSANGLSMPSVLLIF